MAPNRPVFMSAVLCCTMLYSCCQLLHLRPQATYSAREMSEMGPPRENSHAMEQGWLTGNRKTRSKMAPHPFPQPPGPDEDQCRNVQIQHLKVYRHMGSASRSTMQSAASPTRLVVQAYSERGRVEIQVCYVTLQEYGPMTRGSSRWFSICPATEVRS